MELGTWTQVLDVSTEALSWDQGIGALLTVNDIGFSNIAPHYSECYGQCVLLQSYQAKKKKQYCYLVFMYHISIFFHCLAFDFYNSLKTLFIWLVLPHPILFLQKDFLPVDYLCAPVTF